MKWLFRCNIANERSSEEGDVQGIGHAMRCVSLAKEVLKNGDNALLSIDGDPDVKPFLKETGVDFKLNKNHFKIAKSYNADVIVVDINYCGREVLDQFRSIGTVVNLAPRGISKYYADLTFTSEEIRDVSEPEDALLKHWYSGPEYTIISDDFINQRKKLLAEGTRPERKYIVIHMGGVDKYDRTGTVLQLLDERIIERVQFKIIAGPFNPNVNSLKTTCDRYGDQVELLIGPDNLADELSDAMFGILGTGISTYEALAIGVPSINIGLSEFHDKRGKFLESEDLAIYLGNKEDLTATKLNNIIKKSLDGKNNIGYLQKEGPNIVDGKAAKRIIKKTQNQVRK